MEPMKPVKPKKKAPKPGTKKAFDALLGLAIFPKKGVKSK